MPTIENQYKQLTHVDPNQLEPKPTFEAMKKEVVRLRPPKLAVRNGTRITYQSQEPEITISPGFLEDENFRYRFVSEHASCGDAPSTLIIKHSLKNPENPLLGTRIFGSTFEPNDYPNVLKMIHNEDWTPLTNC